MSSLMEEIKNEQKKYGAGSGDYFKFDEKGVYKMRIAHKPKVIATHFFGKGVPAIVCVGIDEGCEHHKEDEKKPSIKLATYIIDRSDGKVKLAELPLSISYALNDLQQDSDFAFEDFPMPYDVKITYDPDNTDPKAIYRLVASPKVEPLTTEEEASLTVKLAKMTPEQYVEMRKNKVKNKAVAVDEMQTKYPASDGNPEEIPF